MRSMMLIYTQEASPEAMPPEEQQQTREGHQAMIEETRKRGVLLAVNPLDRTTAATTVESVA